MQKGSMSTLKSNPIFESALSGVPKKFRARIIESYLELKRRYNQAKHDASWDASGLSAGKYCESVIRFLQEALTGTFTPFGTHIKNFPDECRKLISLPVTSGNESLRIIIPRGLVFLNTFRGKRGIGHVGGDVEANGIDAATVVRVCDWIMCELIRIYHSMSLEEAQSIVDAVSEKNIPDIWEVAGKKRVLRVGLNYKQMTLLLAYSETEEGVFSEDLFLWIEHSNYSYYKRDVLLALHKARMIEYDKESEIVYISPIGIKEVEENILK